MEKFKVGDRVRLKAGLKSGFVSRDRKLSLNKTMISFLPEVIEIVDFDETCKVMGFWYSFDMLELADDASEYQACQEK